MDKETKEKVEILESVAKKSKELQELSDRLESKEQILSLLEQRLSDMESNISIESKIEVTSQKLLSSFCPTELI